MATWGSKASRPRTVAQQLIAGGMESFDQFDLDRKYVPEESIPTDTIPSKAFSREPIYQDRKPRERLQREPLYREARNTVVTTVDGWENESSSTGSDISRTGRAWGTKAAKQRDWMKNYAFMATSSTGLNEHPTPSTTPTPPVAAKSPTAPAPTDADIQREIEQRRRKREEQAAQDAEGAQKLRDLEQSILELQREVRHAVGENTRDSKKAMDEMKEAVKWITGAEDDLEESIKEAADRRKRELVSAAQDRAARMVKRAGKMTEELEAQPEKKSVSRKAHELSKTMVLEWWKVLFLFTLFYIFLVIVIPVPRKDFYPTPDDWWEGRGGPAHMYFSKPDYLDDGYLDQDEAI